MENLKMIQEYLDGTLNDTYQQELFRYLADDALFRDDFNGYVDMKTRLSEYSASASPPEKLTGGIFSALGYSTQLQPESPSSTGPTPVKSSLLKKAGRISSYLAVAVFAWLAASFFLKESGQQDKSFKMAGLTNVQAGDLMENPLNNNSDISTVSINAEAYVHRNSMQPVFNINLKPDYRNTVQIQPFFDPGLTQSIDNKMVEPVKQNPASIPLTLPVLPGPASGQSPHAGLEFNLCSSMSRSFPEIPLPSQISPSISAFNITGYYNLDENHSLGISFGREAFGQEFLEHRDGKPYMIRQNPMLWWYGLAYKYEPDINIFGFIRPYGSMFLGHGTVGPLGRIGLGIILYPDSPVSLLAGFEGSVLAYPVENTFYFTKKAGLNFGIGLNY